jgi:hypothetical protein
MYYRYQPYPYYRRYYNLDPYYYRRYYNPYYNVIDSQIANVDQSMINYGDMADVSQDSVIYQSRTAKPKTEHKEEKEPETIDVPHNVSVHMQPAQIVQEQQSRVIIP